MTSVKPLPAGLPPASSPKWHQRRAWDALGYLRARSLANPEWDRDMPWLIKCLRRELPSVDHPLRPLYDDAMAAAHRYPRTQAGSTTPEASWDELLAAIDAILLRRQHAHLDAVRAAAVSGDQIPPSEPEEDG